LTGSPTKHPHLHVADGDYEEVCTSGHVTTPGSLIDGGDHLLDLIADELHSGQYDRVSMDGPVIVLTKPDGRGGLLRSTRFIPLSFGHPFTDHDHPYVRELVTVLRQHGMLPLLRRGEQPVGSGFSVASVPGRSDAATVVLIGGPATAWNELAVVLHDAGHRVEGEHDGTGVLDVSARTGPASSTVTPVPGPDRYWTDLWVDAVAYAVMMNHVGDLVTSAAIITEVHRHHGMRGVTDLSAMLLSLAHEGCPDTLRDSTGRPDADMILRGSDAEAVRAMDAPAHMNHFVGTCGSDVTEVPDPHAQVAVQRDAEVLVRSAFAAAPQAGDIAAVLRLASGDPRAALWTLDFATLALRRVDNFAEDNER